VPLVLYAPAAPLPIVTSGKVVVALPPDTGVPVNFTPDVEVVLPPLNVTNSAVETVVPSSVMLELVGAPPAPPPLTRMLELRMPDEVSVVVLLKYGMPPLVTVPATVTGYDGVPPPPVETHDQECVEVL
jgi:hypothetical protein